MTNHTHTEKDIVIGAESEAQFSIDGESEVIFDILRSKMYSDKIGAICREVSSNSRDANREAGRGHIPPTIAIYSSNDSETLGATIEGTSISFEDCGPGITPERMVDVFLKYGASTKRATNGQTGGFGLGAKTPFAYTDTFTIATVCDVDGKRMKYVYTAIIDASGKGKMILFDSSESDSATGTKIIVPLKSYDRDEFESKCIEMSLFWPVRPTLKGFNRQHGEVSPELVHVCEEDEMSFSVYFADKLPYRLQSTIIAQIDGIPYSVKTSEVNTGNWSWRFPMVLEFGNGDLTISASREELQYDEHTKEVLETRIAATIGMVDSMLIEEMRSIEGKVPQMLFCTEGSLFNNRCNVGSTASKELKELGSNRFNVKGLTAYKLEMLKGKYMYTETQRVTDAWTDGPIYMMDTKRDRRRAATLLSDRDSVIVFKEYEVDGSEAREEFLSNAGVEIKMFSSVEKAELANTAASPYAKKPTVEVKALNVEGGRCELTWDRATGKIEGNGDYVYVTVDSLRDHTDGFYGHWREQAVLIAALSGKKLMAVNNKSAERYMDTVISLEDYWPTMCETFSEELKEIASQSQMDVLSRAFSTAEFKAIEVVSGTDYSSTVKESEVPSKVLYAYSSLLKSGMFSPTATPEISTMLLQIRKDYPLINSILSGLRYSNDAEVEEAMEEFALYVEIKDGSKNAMKACA